MTDPDRVPHPEVLESEVRARVHGWPGGLGECFERVVAHWYPDRDAHFIAELLEELVAVVLAPLNVAIDTDPRLAEKLGALLKLVDERRDLMPDQPPRPPSDLHGCARIFSELWERDAEPRTNSGTFQGRDREPREPRELRFRPTRPFPEPDWLGEDRPR